MANIAITGAGRGIGFELARQYAEAGDTVYALCRNPAKADDLLKLASEYQNLKIVEMDVGSDVSVRAAVSKISPASIDVLYNVAGIIGPYEAELESSDWDAWDEVLNILLKAPLRVLQAFLPLMASGSKVMTLTSQLGASTWPYGGLYAYSAAKAGLNRLMRSVSIDLKDRGVVVGLIHPGYVQTDMGGPGAEITPAESASGIRSITANWSIDDTGEFLKWNGEKHAW